MRILVLSNTPFAPPTAGNRRRIHDMLAWLRARGAAVAMLMLPAEDRGEWDVAAMRTGLDAFEIAEEIAPPRPSRPERLLRRLAPTLPHRPDGWCPPAFRDRAARFAAAWRPDVVLVEYVFLSACIPALRALASPPRVVIDTHDLMHRRVAAYGEAGLRAQWFHTTRGAERRGLARADLVLAIQEDDARVLRTLVRPDAVLTVPHAQPVAPAPLAAATSQCLVAASYNDINVVGLEWLLREVWPRLRAALPAAELVVCGNVIAKIGVRPAGVAFRGVVPSLDDAYAASRVVLVPVPSGTGLKVKLVEALCHGRPVVTTPAGAAGVDAGEGTGVAVAADAEAFVAATRRLLEDEVAWRAAAGAAAAHARRRFAPDAAFAPLWDALEGRVRRDD
ncbi:MAG: glycosyltransferase family 4 protein [bacterium]|nr:glycosyltransferase family 4 protein [bacterium]